jgi:protein-disulfide isomerase
MAGYLFGAAVCLVTLFTLASGLGRAFLLLFALASNVASAVLVYVMYAFIKSFCVLCLALDAVNIGLLVMAFLACRQSGMNVLGCVARDFKGLVTRPAFGASVVVPGAALLVAAHLYGARVAAASDRADLAPGVRADGPAGKSPEEPAQWTSALHSNCDDQCGCKDEKKGSHTLQMGTDDKGHPWVGGSQPRIVIHEFTDYECPHCRKAHLMVRKLLSKYADRIRVVHRYFPLSSTCNSSIQSEFHRRACELCAVAACAGKQGRFFEMNDFLFQHAQEIREQSLTARQIAQRLELDLNQFDCCLADKTTMDPVKADVEEGILLGIKGTPAFVIDGTVYYGKIPDEAVRKLE